MTMKMHVPTVPADLDQALLSAKLDYSSAKTIFFLVWSYGQNQCGVFGDGDNAAYEWFIWDGRKLETSNAGYGSAEVALRHVLNKEAA
jgi:hypothetical protein